MSVIMDLQKRRVSTVRLRADVGVFKCFKPPKTFDRPLKLPNEAKEYFPESLTTKPPFGNCSPSTLALPFLEGLSPTRTAKTSNSPVSFNSSGTRGLHLSRMIFVISSSESVLQSPAILQPPSIVTSSPGRGITNASQGSFPSSSCRLVTTDFACPLTKTVCPLVGKHALSLASSPAPIPVQFTRAAASGTSFKTWSMLLARSVCVLKLLLFSH